MLVATRWSHHAGKRHNSALTTKATAIASEVSTMNRLTKATASHKHHGRQDTT